MLALHEVDPPPSGRRHRLRLLGGFRLEVDGVGVLVPANGQRVLAYVGLRGRCPRAELAGTLWPEVSERNAAGSLRTSLWRLHRCGAEVLDTVDGVVSVAAEVAVDVRQFADTARHVLRDGGSLRTDDLSSGLRVVASDSELLPGWYDDWVLFERERLRQLRLHTLEALAVRLAEQRDWAAALDTALEVTRIEPLRESAHRVVIAVHLAEGNVVEAMRHYRFVVELLRAELGVAPSAELARMVPPPRASGDAYRYEPVTPRRQAPMSWHPHGGAFTAR